MAHNLASKNGYTFLLRKKNFIIFQCLQFTSLQFKLSNKLNVLCAIIHVIFHMKLIFKPHKFPEDKCYFQIFLTLFNILFNNVHTAVSFYQPNPWLLPARYKFSSIKLKHDIKIPIINLS